VGTLRCVLVRLSCLAHLTRTAQGWERQDWWGPLTPVPPPPPHAPPQMGDPRLIGGAHLHSLLHPPTHPLRWVTRACWWGAGRTWQRAWRAGQWHSGCGAAWPCRYGCGCGRAPVSGGRLSETKKAGDCLRSVSDKKRSQPLKPPPLLWLESRRGRCSCLEQRSWLCKNALLNSTRTPETHAGSSTPVSQPPTCVQLTHQSKSTDAVRCTPRTWAHGL